MLVYNEKLYVTAKVRDQVTTWRCQLRTCKGRITVGPDDNVIVINEHSCSIGGNDIAVLRVKNQIREKISIENGPILNTYATETASLDLQALGDMPSYESIRDAATKLRNLRYDYIPSDRNNVPLSLQKTLDGLGFYQFEISNESIGHIIIFYSDGFIDYINNSDSIVVDGTFRTAPHDFYQLVTIQFKIFRKFLPLVFILTNKKTEETYTKIFEILREKTNINARYVVCDFEKALANASRFLGDNVCVSGCSFHYAQSIWRKIQALGIARFYLNNSDIRSDLNMIFNLPYINIYSIYDAYNFAKEKIESHKELINIKEFFNYFEKTYIGSSNTKPLYSLEFWNVCDRVINGLPRTTNSLEGWHRGFNQMVNTHTPNLGKFVDCLRHETEKTRGKIARFLQGKNEINTRNANLEERIMFIVENQKFMDIEIIFKFLSKTNTWNNLT